MHPGGVKVLGANDLRGCSGLKLLHPNGFYCTRINSYGYLFDVKCRRVQWVQCGCIGYSYCTRRKILLQKRLNGPGCMGAVVCGFRKEKLEERC